MTEFIRPPISWLGGKFYLAQRIVAAFPPADAYDCYIEPFGGAAHVLLRKPSNHHTEMYNDRDDDLVNFWMCMRDHATEMKKRLETLPYARSLLYNYHRSLYDGSSLDEIERAVRWFYVVRASFLPILNATAAPKGWNTVGINSLKHNNAAEFTIALQAFDLVSQRFRHVEIDNRDFAFPLTRFASSQRVLFYVDPPYPGTEWVYRARFQPADHDRLAELLNASRAYVALSYAASPAWLDERYPADRWRRLYWHTRKHSQRSKRQHELVEEVLLMNYEVSANSQLPETKLGARDQEKVS